SGLLAHATRAPRVCPTHVGHALELVTVLGDDVVERRVARGAWQLGGIALLPSPRGYTARCGDREAELPRGASIRVACGQGWIVVTVTARPRRELPYAASDRRPLGFVACSLAAH